MTVPPLRPSVRACVPAGSPLLGAEIWLLRPAPTCPSGQALGDAAFAVVGDPLASPGLTPKSPDWNPALLALLGLTGVTWWWWKRSWKRWV